MQNGQLNINMAIPAGAYGACVNVARRLSICSLVLRVINAELTVLTFWLTPPPRLTYKKYYISQNGIDFRGFLSLPRLHALRFARSVSLQAVFLHSTYKGAV